MSQTYPLPRVHLRPRNSGRANMLQWSTAHAEIAQPVPLRQAFQEQQAAQIARFLGQDLSAADVVRRIAEAEAAGRVGEAQRMRTALARANQYAVVETLLVDRSPRYQQEPPKTYCNIYAYDVVTALGGYLPRVWWTDAAIQRLRNGEALEPVYGQTVRELSANMLTDWMWTYGGEFGWTPAADIPSAQMLANHGWLVILLAARINKAESGHVNIILAETEEHQAERDETGNVYKPLQSQAGAKNFRYQPHPSRWWQANGYERGGAWVFGGAPDSPVIPTEQLPTGGGGIGMGAIRPQEAVMPQTRPTPLRRHVPAPAREAASGESFPGRAQGSGYYYDGRGAADYTRQRVAETIARYTDEGDRPRAQACQVFLELAPRRGWPSAVDTSGEAQCVWGPGFASDGTLPWLWRYLDDRVKAHLAAHPRAAAYFGGDAPHITYELRRDTTALNALVHISEQEPYRALVLDAQLEAWIARIMGVGQAATQEARTAVDDPRVLNLAADLAQWTPGVFRLPEALEQAISLARDGADKAPDPLAVAAGVILAHARRLLADDRYAETDARARRVYKPRSAGDESPIARYQRDLRELLGADRAPLTFPTRATTLIPSLRRGEPPFFVGVADIDNLPRNRFVMVHEGLYYDLGPRG